MKKNRFTFVVLLMLILSTFCFADNDNSLLLKGLDAFRQKDWTTALFFLRKAATLPENNTAETWYVLIMSEVNAADYEGR